MNIAACREAAQIITDLQGENERLRTALTKIGIIADTRILRKNALMHVLNLARAALASTTSETKEAGS